MQIDLGLPSLFYRMIRFVSELILKVMHTCITHIKEETPELHRRLLASMALYRTPPLRRCHIRRLAIRIGGNDRLSDP